jgi:hypothetical protein
MPYTGSSSQLSKRKKNDSSDKSISHSSSLINIYNKADKQQRSAKIKKGLKNKNKKNMSAHYSKINNKEVFSEKKFNSNSDNGLKKDEEDDKKQMVSACCVCSDDTGYSDNLLVYCDGKGCQVAVHQGCYGIITVPEGPWFCRMCEYKHTSKTSNNNNEPNPHIITKCELCPLREGAVKRTDSGKWAHVVCALYIPEITFGNVRTMEPIILKEIRLERYSKRCSICETNDSSENELNSNPNANANELNSNDLNKGNLNSSNGVYVNCNKSGCKHWFHVTW